MRLIDIDTLELRDFVDPPSYAILSHRWTDDEIAYEAYCDPALRKGKGYDKIVKFCPFAKEQSERDSKFYTYPAVRWAWVDTCCMYKRSSAELSEAINSMWDWYWNSKFCVVYLADVSLDESASATAEGCNDAVIASEWFKRGWTLQELLAPAKLIFCSRNWKPLDPHIELPDVLSTASGVPIHYLMHREDVFNASVAMRMSWASSRETTMKEDIAYCLFGLFKINLPLLYGEGHRAYMRLQQEIIDQSYDESILAWSLPPSPFMPLASYLQRTGILAPHPNHFWQSSDIRQLNLIQRDTFEVNERHVLIDSSLIQVQSGLYLLKLNCGVVLPRLGHDDGKRLDRCALSIVPDCGAAAPKPSYESRGCLIPLVLNSEGGFLRTHINSCSSLLRRAFESLESFTAAVGAEVIPEFWNGKSYTSSVLDRAVHRLIIRDSVVPDRIARSGNIDVLEPSLHDTLWKTGQQWTPYACLVPKNGQSDSLAIQSYDKNEDDAAV